MKKPLHFYIFIAALLCCFNTALSQQISVNGNVTIRELIEDNLVDGCVEVSNITSFINGNATGFRSYAEFNRGSSNFPFENGIMLSTGAAESGGNNLTTTTLSEGATTWGTDPDLETALGIFNTLNATSIEFDFTSISSQVQFNYLFASEEYLDVNQCNVSDGFAFLIREVGSVAPYQNIALVPGTATPVSVSTVREGFNAVAMCEAQNEQYFDGQNIGDTNYNGRTEILTASTTIVPYVQYHVKLVIADGFDSTFDSAVFIEGNSFKILDLGEDIDTCAQSVTLNAEIGNPTSTYEWFFNGSTTPISGQNNPTLDVTQSGTYRVEITNQLNSSNCIEEDEIVVNIQNEITLDPLSDYMLCDDLSGDETETFDVSTKDAELLAIITFANPDFSYHLSDSDARNDIDPITSPIQNSSLTQPIFIRVDDMDSGCIAYSTFNLVVNPIPNIVDPTNLPICDSDNDPSDGITTINLREKDDEITNSQSDLVVSYHYNSLDTTTGNNPIPDPENYVNTNTPTETVYVRVVNAVTGCYNNSSLTIDITNGPVVNREPFPLDGCDSDHDGTDTFDLTQAIADILEGLTGVTTTFHENLADAEEGINAIADETNYQNVTPDEQTIFVRVEDNVTGCASIVRLQIHTNLLLTGTDTGDFALCDDPSNDGFIDFDLFTVERFILENFADENGDIPPEYEVTFYESETEFNNNNPIDKNLFYTASNPTTLFIQVESGSCSEITEINLLVNPVLVFNPIDPVDYCDDDDDGIVSIDLSVFDELITGGNPDFEVSYFGSQTDAETNFNQYPPFYTNSMPQETVFARVENIGTGCFTINQFEIAVVAAPAITNPAPWLICDTDQDGLSILDLEDRFDSEAIVADRTGLTISYHTTIDDANNNTNPIDTPTSYETGTQDIFIRVESITSECYAIATLEIFVNTLPVISSIDNFQICEDDDDEMAEFLFSDWDAQILNGQTGKEVFYFEDAALTIPIDKTTPYTNTSSPQTIHLRVENITDPNCNATASFFIEVGANPVYNTPGSFLICDDASNDGIGVFDFNRKINEISQGSTTNLNIDFFATEQNAIDNIDPLPLQYTNTLNPETIYVRIENQDSSCVLFEDFGINVVASPDLSDAEILSLCDDDYDGTTEFDLDDADYENFDRFQTNITINYFENMADIDNDALAIPNPNTYVSGSKTVYIKVTNNQTTCYTAIPLELEVMPLPVVNFNGTLPICDNDTNTFDLSTVDDMLVDDTSTVIINYFDSAVNAQNNTGALSNAYTYTSTSHVIHTRIESLTNGCIALNSFTLQINPNPIANTPQDLSECDDDLDGFLVFDLTNANSDILGTQASSDYDITYYSTLANAETKTDQLNPMHESVDGEIIFYRIENRATGCFNTNQFSTIINPLPIIPIEDSVTLCLDDLPLVIDASTGNPNDSYVWSTTVNSNVDNSTSPTIVVNNASQIGAYTVTISRLYANGNNCSNDKTITVIESEQAMNVTSTTTNFTDPNRITVNVDGIGNYVFTLDEDKGGEPQTSNIFENVTIGPHTITVEDLNGCEPVTIDAFVIDIPKFVTPNGDDSFDTWHIVGIEQLPGTLIYIYNRHGKLLKMLPHTSPGWDGTFNGQNMPADDYWFSANIIQNGESFNIRGHFALKR